MVGLICLVILISLILIYIAFLPLSAKDTNELKQYFIFGSIILLILGVAGHLYDKTNNDGFILGIFIFILFVICITGSIKALALKEPDYPVAILSYCFLMYFISNAIVTFFIWSGLIIEGPKFTGG